MRTIKKFNRNSINENNIEIEDDIVNNKDKEVDLFNPNKLPEDVEKELNELIGYEYTAHYFYRNATNWCKNVNYKKATSFFENESVSELEHSKGLQDYITQWNSIPVIPTVKTEQSFSGLVEIIKGAYQMEWNLLLKYSKVQQMMLEKHPATFNFIQKYVDIQNTAVAEYSDLLNALQLVNTENKLDLLIFEDRYFL